MKLLHADFHGKFSFRGNWLLKAKFGQETLLKSNDNDLRFIFLQMKQKCEHYYINIPII